MKTFVKASEIKMRKEKIDKYRVDKFIEKFNRSIIHDSECESGDSSFTINDLLDKVPTLNDNEFECAVELAKEQGWKLTRSDDNYQSVTYKMQKI